MCFRALSASGNISKSWKVEIVLRDIGLTLDLWEDYSQFQIGSKVYNSPN
jgi:hypothetical protein